MAPPPPGAEGLSDATDPNCDSRLRGLSMAAMNREAVIVDYIRSESPSAL